MIIHYSPEGYPTCNTKLVERTLLDLESDPVSDKIFTSSEVVVHEAYRLYRERRIREFVLIADNSAWIADPDRVMRNWPEGLDPEAAVLDRLVS